MQTASVIGRDFAYKILGSIMELGDDLRAHLTNLVGLEVLYEKSLYPELEYIFKHALTQEVAYPKHAQTAAEGDARPDSPDHRGSVRREFWSSITNSCPTTGN